MRNWAVGQLISTLEEKAEVAGIAVILVEHVMTAVRALCHRVIVMNAGSKIAEGRPETVLRDTEVIRAYLGETKDEETHAGAA